MEKGKFRGILSLCNACVFKNHVHFISQGNLRNLNENTSQRTVCPVLNNHNPGRPRKGKPPKKGGLPTGAGAEHVLNLESNHLK